jgi:hypothetical protein
VYLEKFIEIMPAVPSFDEWLEHTGELPPDFDALPEVNGLPDPLRFLDGSVVATPNDRRTQRSTRPPHERC